MSEKTNFEKVLEFNKSFGVKTHTEAKPDIFVTDPKLVQHRLNLITEEYEELKDAIEKHDYGEMCDALCDLLYVIYGCCSSTGIQADKAFKIVHDSNMSKLCKTEDEAQRTVEAYKLIERYKSPKYRLSDDGVNYVVYDAETTKILKSIDYNPVDFSGLF